MTLRLLCCARVLGLLPHLSEEWCRYSLFVPPCHCWDLCSLSARIIARHEHEAILWRGWHHQAAMQHVAEQNGVARMASERQSTQNRDEKRRHWCRPRSHPHWT